METDTPTNAGAPPKEANGTPINTQREIHLNYVLFANQQILTDRPSFLPYGKVGYDEVTPREKIPPMLISLENLTAKQFKSEVSNHLMHHCSHLPIWLIIDNGDQKRAVEWTYRIRDDVNNRSGFSEDWKVAGHGNDGFADFLAAARDSSPMAKIYVDLRMNRPSPQEMAPDSDMEEDEDELATSAPSQPIVYTKWNNPYAFDFAIPSDHDLTLNQFLMLCKIPPDDPKIKKLFDDHEIHHWSAFKDVTKEVLRGLGFAFGPVQLIHAGVLKWKKIRPHAF